MVNSKASIPLKKKIVKSSGIPVTVSSRTQCTQKAPPDSASNLNTTPRPKNKKAANPRKVAGNKKQSPTRKKASATSPSRKRKSKDSLLRKDAATIPPAVRPTTTQYDAAGVYGPLIRLKRKRQLDTEIPIVPLPPRIIGGLRDQLEKAKHCNCKRSHCLKLYCECFASGIHCSPLCNCVSCHNNEASDEKHRNDAVLATLERNPHAFRPRVIAIAGAAASISRDARTAALSREETTVEPPHSMMGCNCRKSFCLKKYCECFQAAVYCNPPHCKCKLCQNVEGNPTRERLVAKRRSQAEAAAAAAALAHQHSRLGHMSGRMSMLGDTGRSYYGVDHTGSHANASASEKGVTVVEATKAAQAAAAAGGVDVFLPPSSYTVPLQLHGTPYVGISFGAVGKKLEGQSKSKEATDQSQQKPLPPSNSLPKGQQLRPNCRPMETSLERFWREESEKAESLFKAINNTINTKKSTKDSEINFNRIKNETQIRQNSQTPVNEPSHETKLDIPENRRSPSPHTSLLENEQAQQTIASTGGDVQRLVAAALKAKEATMQLMDSTIEASSVDDPLSDKLDQEANTHTNTPDSTSAGAVEDNVLTCHETLDSEDEQVSIFAMRELTVLAVQDTAILRELAQIIRQKALALGRARRVRANEEEKQQTTAERVY